MATAPTTELDNTDEHSTTALYRAAIGDISNGYYLPRFTRFDTADRPGLSWNWAAAVNTLNWLMFRQLWHAALVYAGSIVALAVVVLGLGKLVFQFSEGTQWGMVAALVGLAFVVPGLGGNALYYLATRQRVQNALVKNQTVTDACAQISREASTRKGMLMIAAGNGVALAICAQSYAMFTGFEPLPAGTPIAVTTPQEPRNVASGRAVDATLAQPAPAQAASAAKPAASAASSAAVPQVASSAAPPKALPAASAPAPLPAPAPSAPTPPASKPVAKPTPTAGPAPVALRSEAAIAAARAAAQALGQTVPAATPVSAAAPEPAALIGRFVVNVGLFADSNNARNAMVKLMDAELPVVSKEIRFPKGNRTRLQVGPFDTLAEADAAADKVRALELEARVAPVP